VDHSGALPAFDDAFPALYHRAYQAAFRLTGDRPASEDLAQEALTRAYSRWATLDDRREGWVVTTTVRLAISRWRREGRPNRPPVVYGDPALDHVVSARLDLTRLLAALPRRQREVAVLRYLEDRPEREVAELLGCSVGSVKRHASRAAESLRRSLSIPLDHTPEVS
jgi:DNA-directed RNA polymerase specialized sigma24 family protein